MKFLITILMISFSAVASVDLVYTDVGLCVSWTCGPNLTAVRNLSQSTERLFNDQCALPQFFIRDGLPDSGFEHLVNTWKLPFMSGWFLGLTGRRCCRWFDGTR